MTMKEISILFGCSERIIEMCFKEYEKINPDIKLRKTGRNISANFSIAECVEALDCLSKFRFTPMMSRYLKEHFMDHPGLQYKRNAKIKVSQSARCFLFFYPKKKYVYKSCTTCAYFIAKQMNHRGSGLHPFCTFYNCFLNKVKPYRDIYKSHCETYMRGNRTPLVWTSAGVFEYYRIKAYDSNFIILPDNKTLGIDNKEFKSKRKKGEEIVIFKDLYDSSDF